MNAYKFPIFLPLTDMISGVISGLARVITTLLQLFNFNSDL